MKAKAEEILREFEKKNNLFYPETMRWSRTKLTELIEFVKAQYISKITEGALSCSGCIYDGVDDSLCGNCGPMFIEKATNPKQDRGIVEWLENKITGCDELGGMEKEKWAFQQCLKEVKTTTELLNGETKHNRSIPDEEGGM